MLELFDLGGVSGAGPGTSPVVDVGLVDPVANRFDPVAELFRTLFTDP